MPIVLTAADISSLAEKFATVSGAHLRTFKAIFHHPSAHNIKWADVVALIDEIGVVHVPASDKAVFEIAGHRQLFHKPQSKDMTSSDVEDVRHFLMRCGSSPELPSQPVAQSFPPAPNLLIVVDHREARIFHVDVTSEDPAMHGIKPHAPHHFLHHLVHKDQAREQGQRAPEQACFYEKIADAAAVGGRIVILGHGKGKSNAAHHLADYLLKHHRETHQRVVHQGDADLSRITEPQLLVLAKEALRA